MADSKRKPADDEADFKTARQPDEDEKPLGRDDRVSLWPLSFEDVVRALHRTPRTRHDEKSGEEG